MGPSGNWHEKFNAKKVLRMEDSKKLTINFDKPRKFEPKHISGLEKVRGLYFIFLTEKVAHYPFKLSKLIYIGMSEKSSNSIAARLCDHYEGKSGNVGLVNYRTVEPLRFTYLNFDTLNGFWSQKVEDLESYFILDFVREHGVYPICNNKTGFPDFDPTKTSRLNINWSYFLE